VGVVVDTDDKDALIRITLGAGVFEHVEQVASLNRRHHGLKAEAPFGQQHGIFLVAPGERTHEEDLASLCA
jgi:hypothetical protein